MENVMGVVCVLGGLSWFWDAYKPENVSLNMQRFSHFVAGFLVFTTGLRLLGVDV